MKYVFDADIDCKDDLSITYQIHDKKRNRILYRGYSTISRLPDEIKGHELEIFNDELKRICDRFKENCLFCEHYDGKYCLFGDEPIKIFHTGGECLWKGQR